jgi:hypothetical protein
MKIKFIEAVNVDRFGGTFNWGKFCLFQFDAELRHPSMLQLDDPEEDAIQRKYPLLTLIGYSHKNIIVFDLQTREGAAFIPAGYAEADLNAKKIWVCPMYEPFLTWLYTQDCSDINKLPSVVKLPFEGEFRGFRRAGLESFTDGEGI